MPEGPLVAIVDDDKSIRNATQDLLKAAGFYTVTFEDAESFLGSASRATAACLVADMRMPGMSGVELYQTLVASGHSIPTVIITAHPEEVTQVRGRVAGLTCYLIKPFTPDELLECVHEALAKSERRGAIPKC
jgi:two-component system, LuxR family, response regulator FixJ